MDVQGWTFLIVGLSFALYIGIAWWARAASTGEFYVAGKGVPPIANGMATAADWMSAASFLGMAGLPRLTGQPAPDPSFTNDKFGLSVGCDAGQAAAVREQLEQYGATEIRE